MSRSTKLPFSVAKFAIEGAGEGADQIRLICPAPPRLPDTQTALLPKLLFPIDPFSLSRSSLSNLHTHVSSYQNSVDTCNNGLPSPASVSFASPSSYVHSLFPNPFLVNRNFNSQPAPIVTSISKPVTTTPFTPSISLVRPVLQHYKPPITHTITSSLPLPRIPRKPRPDRVLASSPYRPRVMAVDRLLSWRTPYGISHDQPSSLLLSLN